MVTARSDEHEPLGRRGEDAVVQVVAGGIRFVPGVGQDVADDAAQLVLGQGGIGAVAFLAASLQLEPDTLVQLGDLRSVVAQ